MSNGAGRALDAGNNRLANALIDSLTEGVARRNSDGRILIDRNSAAGQRLTARFGGPRGGKRTYWFWWNSIPICREWCKKCSWIRILKVTCREEISNQDHQRVQDFNKIYN